jgi:excisionase family DNA binding protein
MNPATLRAIKAILETDPSIPSEKRSAILRSCEEADLASSCQRQVRPQFVTVREAAEILCTSTRTIWRLAGTGKLTRIKLGHRSTRFRMADIANITSVDEPGR